jgi:hypothetical protein
MDAEDLYSFIARQPLDDVTCEMDAGGTDRPFAQHARDYSRHFVKKAAFIRVGSA